MKQPSRFASKPTISTDARAKAHLDMVMHQNNLQWSRFQPLYWIEATYLGGTYLVRMEPLYVRVGVLGFALLSLGYLLSLSWLDWKIKRKHLNALEKLGFILERPKRPNWWPPLPAWDIVSLFAFYLGIFILNVIAVAVAPRIDHPEPERAAPVVVGVMVQAPPAGPSPAALPRGPRPTP